jgi:hypothetical protein
MRGLRMNTFGLKLRDYYQSESAPVDELIA